MRFTSPHPAAFTDDVIEAMAQTPQVMPSLHMPLQSGSDRVLRAMRRSYRSARFLGILERVRAAIPEAAITTDLIVGFPGETEEDFQATLDVVQQARFASAFTFEYSPRPGTPAADLPQVPVEVVKDRYRRLDELVRRITHEENVAQEGRVVEVLVAEGEGRRDAATCQVLVAEGEGRRDAATCRISGRAEDNRLVHLWLDDGPALFQVRRTRAGEAWQRRQAEACSTPEPDTAPVSIGMPTIRVGAPGAGRRL